MFFSDVNSKMPQFETEEDTNTFYDKLVEDYSHSLDSVQGLEESPAIKYFDQTLSDKMIKELFNKLYKMNAYKQDCYDTNKFLHFLSILKKKGFDITNEYKKIEIPRN